MFGENLSQVFLRYAVNILINLKNSMRENHWFLRLFEGVLWPDRARCTGFRQVQSERFLLARPTEISISVQADLAQAVGPVNGPRTRQTQPERFLLIRPVEILISVQAEPAEALRTLNRLKKGHARGERLTCLMRGLSPVSHPIRSG